MQAHHSQVEFRRLIQEIQNTRAKDYMLIRIDEIQNTVHKLIQAFR